MDQIGILVVEKKLPKDCFLPGLSIGANCIYVDFDQLVYPGDILHEAGHLAVTKSEDRSLIGTDKMSENWPSQGDEIAAMLWSYAALKHLQLPVEYVFHPNGYKGNSDWLIANFTSGNYIGLPLLEWMGLTYGNEKREMKDLKPFPTMKKWLRD